MKGPPWLTGKTERSRARACSCVERMKAPRGPRRDLWVVEVTICAWGDRVRMDAARDEAGDVGHVDEEDGVDLVGDGAEAGPIDGAGVGAVAGDDELGAVLLGERLDLLVVDELGVRVDAVGDDVVVLAGEVDGAAVGEVAAVVKAHAHEGLAGLHEGGVDGDVGLGAGVGLDVGVFGAEEAVDALDGEGLGHVDELAAAVIAAGRGSPRRTCWS